MKKIQIITGSTPDSKPISNLSKEELQGVIEQYILRGRGELNKEEYGVWFTHLVTLVGEYYRRTKSDPSRFHYRYMVSKEYSPEVKKWVEKVDISNFKGYQQF